MLVYLKGKHPEVVPLPCTCFQVNYENRGLKLIENSIQTKFSHCLERSGELLVAVRRVVHMYTHDPNNFIETCEGKSHSFPLYRGRSKTQTKADSFDIRKSYSGGQNQGLAVFLLYFLRTPLGLSVWFHGVLTQVCSF